MLINLLFCMYLKEFNMGCIIEFQEPSVRINFRCNNMKQKIYLEILLKYSPLDITNISSILNIPKSKLYRVYLGKELLEGKVANNLACLLCIFLGE